MTKGTTGRRGRTRPDTPKTIDLAASEVTPMPEKPVPEKPVPEKPAPEKPAPETRTDEAKATEALREDESARTTAATSRDLSGFGATASIDTPADEKPEAPLSGTGKSEKQEDSKKPDEPPARPGSAGAGQPGAWGRGEAKSGAAAKSPPRQAAGAGLAGSLVPGLVGALVALVLLGGLNAAGLLRYVPLLGSLAPVEATQAPDLTADVAALDKRIAALEADTRAAPQGPNVSELGARLDALATRLDAVEEMLDRKSAGSGNDAGTAARIDELSQRLSALESLPAATDTGAAGETVAALRGELETLSASLKSTNETAGETADAMSARIDRLQADVDGLSDRIAAASAEGAARADMARTARDVAVDALRAAYRRGEPFGEFLDSLATLSGSSPAIETLRPYASGVATDAQLVDGFDAASRQALDAVTPPGEGVMSRLIANARSLVDVRPAGPVEGDEPRAVLSRVEADHANGDFPAALAEWQFLPAEARQAASAWGDRLAARVAADKALRDLAAAPAGE